MRDLQPVWFCVECGVPFTTLIGAHRGRCPGCNGFYLRRNVTKYVPRCLVVGGEVAWDIGDRRREREDGAGGNGAIT